MATIRQRKTSKKYEVQVRRDGWPKITQSIGRESVGVGH